MARTFSADEVRDVLHELVRRLAERGDTARIYVIGGAAVALENPHRTATADIDGFIRLTDATDIIAAIQRERGLDSEWFNWHAQGLQPPVGGSDMWHEVMRDEGVVLYSANTDALLAMKLNAARAKDTEDIAYLLRACAVSTLEGAEEVYERHYPGDALTDIAIARVEYALSVMDREP
ncbi:MAG: DUF6036 family nucleotidyltransferase [Actinomycetes bacterium]